MNADEIKKIVNEADEDLIRNYVIQWAEGNADFAEFMAQKLCPSIDEIDFADELARVIRNNTSSRMALLFKKHKLTYIKITDLDTKLCKRLSSNAISTITVFHTFFSRYVIYLKSILQNQLA